MHLEQLWPLYAIAIACGLYTLKGAYRYWIAQRRLSALPLNELMTNITPTETPFMRGLKDRSNDRT